eukprot:12388838-Heterocapsa_arctica.AAC.1
MERRRTRALGHEPAASLIVTRVHKSRTFLWMVRVLSDFRRRGISPATRQNKSGREGGGTSNGRQALVKRLPCSRKGGRLGTTGKHVVPG